MKRLSPRSILFLGAWLALASNAGATGACPNRPVTIVAPAAAGGPADAVTRILAEGFDPVLGEGIIIESRAVPERSRKDA